LLSAGQVVDAFQVAQKVAQRDPSPDNEAALAEAQRLLLGMLCPARDKAREKGNLAVALSCARQIFALSPTAEHAAALSGISDQATAAR
jgi:hypothetical protein